MPTDYIDIEIEIEIGLDWIVRLLPWPSLSHLNFLLTFAIFASYLACISGVILTGAGAMNMMANPITQNTKPVA